MRAKPLIVLLFAFVLFSCAKSQGPEKAERPKLPAIDPTDSTVGLGIRILTDGATLVDSSLPTASRNAFRISTDSIDVIKMQRGGSSTVTIRSHPSDVRGQDVLMGWDGEKKYLVLPITSSDSMNGKVKFNITLDSSIEPGLFEVSLALRDTGGRVSKHLRKWVVIGEKSTNVDSLIVGRWRGVRWNGDSTLFTSWSWDGLMLQFSSSGRCGRWFDTSALKLAIRSYLAFYGLPKNDGFLLSSFPILPTKPNLNSLYNISADTITISADTITISADTITAWERTSARIVAINKRKLIWQDFGGKHETFVVAARVMTPK